MYSNMLHVGDPVLDKWSFISSREQHLHHNLSDTTQREEKRVWGMCP